MKRTITALATVLAATVGGQPAAAQTVTTGHEQGASGAVATVRVDPDGQFLTGSCAYALDRASANDPEHMRMVVQGVAAAGGPQRPIAVTIRCVIRDSWDRLVYDTAREEPMPVATQTGLTVLTPFDTTFPILTYRACVEATVLFATAVRVSTGLSCLP